MTATAPTTAPLATAAGASVLDVRGLTVRLPEGADRRNAVQNVSLTVGAGEIVCIVGESGSGKSVTAFTVMGLLPKRQLQPVAGQILFQGEALLTRSPASSEERRVGKAWVSTCSSRGSPYHKKKQHAETRT